MPTAVVVNKDNHIMPTVVMAISVSLVTAAMNFPSVELIVLQSVVELEAI